MILAYSIRLLLALSIVNISFLDTNSNQISSLNPTWYLVSDDFGVILQDGGISKKFIRDRFHDYKFEYKILDSLGSCTFLLHHKRKVQIKGQFKGVVSNDSIEIFGSSNNPDEKVYKKLLKPVKDGLWFIYYKDSMTFNYWRNDTLLRSQTEIY